MCSATEIDILTERVARERGRIPSAWLAHGVMEIGKFFSSLAKNALRPAFFTR